MRIYGPFWHPGFGILGGVFGLLVFAGFIGLLVWALVRLLNHDHPHPSTAGNWAPRDDALNAARVRYARGELDRDQYFRLVEDLTGVPRPPEPPAGPAQPFPTYPAPPGAPAGGFPAPQTPPATEGPGPGAPGA